MIESVEIEAAEHWGQELRLVTVVCSSQGLRSMSVRLLKAPLPLGVFAPDAAPATLQGVLNEIDSQAPASDNRGRRMRLAKRLAYTYGASNGASQNCA
jgi:hypothetical protein